MMNRREFLGRAAKAGAAIAATGAVGYWLHDRAGPKPRRSIETVTLPDFSVSPAGKKMAIVTGSDRVKTVNRALAALGGIETFIKPGDRVVLKVNAAFASPPALSATAHPDLVGEVARLCLRAGAAAVVVTDNPINDPRSCFTLTGIERAAEAAGARVVMPQEGFFRPTTLPGGALIRDWPLLHEPLRGATRLIGIAPVKDHHRSGASMAMKNWYGLLGGRRNIFHQDINTIIAELALLVRPTLVILDGTTTMISNGPTGGSLDDLKQTNTMIVSADQIAADAFGATLLGKTAGDLPFITRAAAAGAGTADWESLNPARESVG
jgi:uncharacterized protein (DUF362 family)